MVEPVEQRQHDRRLDRDALQRRLEAGGLGGDDQRVDRLAQARERARARDEVAERDALNVALRARDHRGGGLAGDHHHVGPHARERACEQAADAARTEHGDVHVHPPCLRRRPLTGASLWRAVNRSFTGGYTNSLAFARSVRPT